METLINFLKIIGVLFIVFMSALMIVYEFTLGVWENTCRCKKPEYVRGLDGVDYCKKCKKEIF